MNNSFQRDLFEEAVFKNLTTVLFGITINTINGLLLYTFLKTPSFTQVARYILYMQMVINDIVLLSVSVILHVVSYSVPRLNVSVCSLLLFIGSATFKTTPLNLAGMAAERFVAICYPLHHSVVCTVRRTFILAAVIWCTGALPSFIDLIIVFALQPISFFASGRLCFYSNIFSFPHNAANNMVSSLSYLCFVCITLFYTYFRVLLCAQRAASDPVQTQRAQRTILLHGVQLLLCTLSYIMPVMDTALVMLFPEDRTVILFCNFIIGSILPRLLSPLIYGLRDPAFRHHMKSLLLGRAVKTSPDPL